MTEEKKGTGLIMRTIAATIGATLWLTGVSYLRWATGVVSRSFKESRAAGISAALAYFGSVPFIIVFMVYVLLVAADRATYNWYEPAPLYDANGEVVTTLHKEGEPKLDALGQPVLDGEDPVFYAKDTAVPVDRFNNPGIADMSEAEKVALIIEASYYDLATQFDGPFGDTFGWLANDPWYWRDDVKHCQGGSRDGTFGGMHKSTLQLLEVLVSRATSLGSSDLTEGPAQKVVDHYFSVDATDMGAGAMFRTAGERYRTGIKEMNKVVEGIRAGTVQVNFNRHDLAALVKTMSGYEKETSNQKGIMEKVYSLLGETGVSWWVVDDDYHASLCALRSVLRVGYVIKHAWGGNPAMLPVEAMQNVNAGLAGLQAIQTPKAKPFTVWKLGSPWPLGHHTHELSAIVGVTYDRWAEDVVGAVSGNN